MEIQLSMLETRWQKNMKNMKRIWNILHIKEYEAYHPEDLLGIFLTISRFTTIWEEIRIKFLIYITASFHGFPWRSQTVKNLPAMQETWVWSLHWEDPLEKGMATHSSILAWRAPRTEEPVGLQYTGSQRVKLYWATFTFTLSCKHHIPLLLSYIII